MKFSIYPNEIIDYIRDNDYIPKKIKYLYELKKFSKYIYLEGNKEGFKIEDIIEINGENYFQIRLLDSGRQAVIPYEEKFHYYELLTDKTDIKNLDELINSQVPYYGSEIKYWFFSHDIDLSTSKYEGFRDYIIPSSFTISDKKMYYLEGVYLADKDIYINCRAILFK